MLLAAAPAAQAADNALIPLDSFVRPDEYSTPRLSPDGKHLALTVRIPRGERMVPTIVVYALPDMKQISANQLPIRQVPISYTWVSNTRLVVERGREIGALEAPQATGEVLAMDYDGKNQQYLYGWDMEKNSRHGDRYTDNEGWGYVSGVPRPVNGRFYLTTHTYKDDSMLYDANATNGSRKLLASIVNPTLSYIIQRDGTPRFATGTNPVKNEHILYRRDDKDNKWHVVDAGPDKVALRPIAFTADDTEFLATITPDGGPRQLVRENLATGKRRTVMSDPVGSIDTFLWGAQQDLPFAAATSIGIPRVTYLNDASEEAKLHKQLSERFAGHFITFINYTDDGSRLLFSAASDREPGAYFLYERATGKAYPLFVTRDQIDPGQMAERRPIKFAARDGLELHGYLTVPNRTDGKRPPLILLPHGGPHGVNDDWFFDNDAQFLASRGYAVLQVNFRGSGGRGSNFQRAGYRHWGTKIQDDLIDGVRWTIAQGLADGERVCAFGTSFGGYAAMMVSIRAPQLFKCAVGFAGVYDLNRFYQERDTNKGSLKHSIYVDYIGTDRDELNRFSPAMLAPHLTVPVLLVHGKDDTIAPFEHAEVMRMALEKAGRPPEYLAVDGEGHGFYATKNATAFYQKLEAFLARHLQ